MILENRDKTTLWGHISMVECFSPKETIRVRFLVPPPFDFEYNFIYSSKYKTMKKEQSIPGQQDPISMEELNLNADTPEMREANQIIFDLLTQNVQKIIEQGAELDVNKDPITNFSQLFSAVAEKIGGEKIATMLKADPSAVYRLGANIRTVIEKATPYLNKYDDPRGDAANNDSFGRRKHAEVELALEAFKYLQGLREE